MSDQFAAWRMGVLTNLYIVLKMKKALFGSMSFSTDFHSSLIKDKLMLACINWIFNFFITTKNTLYTCFFHRYQIQSKYILRIFFFLKKKRSLRQVSNYLCWIIPLRHMRHLLLKLYSYLEIVIYFKLLQAGGKVL